MIILKSENNQRADALQKIVQCAYDLAKKRKMDVIKQFILCPHMLGALTSPSIRREVMREGYETPGTYVGNVRDGYFSGQDNFEYALSRVLKDSKVYMMRVGSSGNNATILYLLESNTDLFLEWVVQEFSNAVVATVQEM